MTQKRRDVRTSGGHRLTRSQGFPELCAVIERGSRCHRKLDKGACPTHGDTTPAKPPSPREALQEIHDVLTGRKLVGADDDETRLAWAIRYTKWVLSGEKDGRSPL